ncbi:VOC family protein [Pseudonocardia broussonetiae]|uniref:VOC domain-containing protein n=1 Tax=Pseudonocardia broussonetiae TaxID=2736640 RepID=A0A6M6JML9_9PSEU|nr:VOC family protein [Pseudonocardia broussonetiae]QJY49324.1 hypothetical protein HOP40_29175 [Pseudonocardia broussonetiae]
MTAPLPPFQGLSHLALSVVDVPAAIAFWVGVFGFEVLTDTPSLGLVVHRPTRVAIALTSNNGSTAGTFDERHPGLDHLAIAVPGVDDLHDWHARLTGLGVPCSPVTDSGSGHHLNLRAPDGVPVELYVIDAATVAALGLADAGEAFAGSR